MNGKGDQGNWDEKCTKRIARLGSRARGRSADRANAVAGAPLGASVSTVGLLVGVWVVGAFDTVGLFVGTLVGLDVGTRRGEFVGAFDICIDGQMLLPNASKKQITSSGQF